MSGQFKAHRGCFSCIALVAVLVVALTASARAAITGIQAEVSVTVQELLDGEPGSFTRDDDAAENLMDGLPLLATAELVSTDLEGRPVSVGSGLAAFSDPTRLSQANPEEFGIEAGCFSEGESVSCLVTGEARERRTVLFVRGRHPTIRPEISFEPNGTRLVESRVFLSGAVVLWSKDAAVSLADAEAELIFRVLDGDSDVALFEASVVVRGAEGDESVVEPTGPIRVEVVRIEDLVAEGLDEVNRAALERAASEGALAVYRLPAQSHLYSYRVSANQPRVLTAALSVVVRSAPGGTGVAATLGRPFGELAAQIDRSWPEVDGQALQRSLNLRIGERDVFHEPPTVNPLSAPMAGVCGAFGFEALSLSLLGFVGWRRRVRRSA